jgi:hypothetical protein
VVILYDFCVNESKNSILSGFLVEKAGENGRNSVFRMEECGKPND